VAKILAPRRTPRLLGKDRYARNGIKPSHIAPLRVAQMANFATARCRKVVYINARSWVNTPATATGDTDSDFFTWHSGRGETGSLRLRMVATCDKNTKFDLNITPDGGAEVTETFDVPDGSQAQLKVVRGFIDITPNTLYTGYITVINLKRFPYSVTLYEEHDAGLTPSDASVVDTRAFGNKRPIYDETHSDLVTVSHNLYTTNGRTLFTIHDEWTRTSSTAVNMLDDTSTTVTSSTPGFNLKTDNLAPLHDPTKVPVVLKVYGQVAAGAGVAAVQLRDSSGTVASVTMGTSLGWYTDSTVDLTPGEKYDVYFKGDSVNQATVRSVVCYLWDA